VACAKVDELVAHIKADSKFVPVDQTEYTRTLFETA
jgi:hypothetical protein